MHYLLIARFTMDDIPLRLYGSYDCATAEDDAKELHTDPTLLDTKWKRSVDKWPLTPRGDFVGAIVLSFEDTDGHPRYVMFDSTAEAVPTPPKTTPPDPAHPPVPEGHIEITDPNHRLRPGIDLFVSSYCLTQSHWNPHQWMYISETDADLISNWSGVSRFCCPADKHPDLQSEPAPPEPSGLSRATDNGTTLASAARCLVSENADLRRRVAELEAENSIMAAKNADLYSANVAYSRKNDELRALNEDLYHRLGATKARAERATELEGKLRGTAQLLLAHFQRLEDRAKWAFRFADEEMMPLPYAKAMLHCQRKFAEEFQGFLHMYPHVLPDIPAEYWPVDDTDDEMND